MSLSDGTALSLDLGFGFWFSVKLDKTAQRNLRDGVSFLALSVMPHYLGVEPLWISSWHSDHSRAAWPPPLHRMAITLCWEIPTNEDWESGWSWPGHSQGSSAWVKLHIHGCCTELCGAI